MHDIDRTQMEYSPELQSFEGENLEFNEQEWSAEGESYGESYGEYEGEGYGEYEGETYGESVLNEAEET